MAGVLKKQKPNKLLEEKFLNRHRVKVRNRGRVIRT
jgi:hypothetical protein